MLTWMYYNSICVFTLLCGYHEYFCLSYSFNYSAFSFFAFSVSLFFYCSDWQISPLSFSFTIATYRPNLFIHCLPYLVQSSSVFSLAVFVVPSFSIFCVLVTPIWCHCRFLCMNGSYSKLEKLERKSPLYGRAKVNTRRKCRSIWQ